MPSIPQPTPWGLGAATRRLAPGICLALFSFLAFAAQAQSLLNFPRLDSGPDALTGIALFNPNNRPASVEITAYGENGTALSGPGIRNPVRITIFARRQYSAVAADLFGGGLEASTVAWFQAKSPLDGIDGFFLAADPATTFLDGAQLPEASTELHFNEIRIAPGSRSEVNLINPNPETAQIALQLRSDGLRIDRQLALGPMGVARIDAAEFFEVGSEAGRAVLKLTSDRPVAGFQLVFANGDAFGLNGRPPNSERASLNFPQFAALAPFSTQLQITNTAAKPATVAITAFRPDGRRFEGAATTGNPAMRSLGPEETLNEDLGELFGFNGEGPVEGWLRVDSNTAGVEGALVYAIPATGSIAAVADARHARKRLVFAYIATSRDFFTGLAVVNTSSIVANLRLAALQTDGVTLGATSLTLGPGQRVSRLVTELIPESQGLAGGLIWLESDVPVRATSLFGSESGGVLANVPPQSVPDDYLPDELPERTRTFPELTTVGAGESRQFSWTGAGQAPVWRVDGIAGGDPLQGTVNGLGLYQAPEELPAFPVTVTAERSLQTSGATVDPLPAPVGVAELGVLEGIAYSSAERRLYAAELITPVGGSTQESGTQILDVTRGDRRLIAFFPSEEIATMVVHRQNDRDRLLLANRSLGTIIRLDPDTLETRTIGTAFPQPRALSLDPLTGDLLVADQSGLVRIPAARVTQGLPNSPPAVGPRRVTLVEGQDPSGIAVDLCSGNIFFSNAGQGALVEFDRASGTTRVAEEELNQPGALLALYRKGLPCPDALHLLVVERPLDQIRLVVPSRQSATEWTRLEGLTVATATTGPGSSELESILLTGFPRGVNASVLQITPPPVYLLRPDPNP